MTPQGVFFYEGGYKMTQPTKEQIDRQMKSLESKIDTLITQMQGDGASGKSMPVQLSGSYVRLSTEPLPTPEADGVKDGNDLLVIDPADKNNNKVYIYRTGAWREV
jgi:hypothetical protein